MKKYVKELIILTIQLYMFYIFPIYAGPKDPMGMVLLIVIATLLLSVILGSISKKKIRYLYPPVISVLFLPSVFIYYNGSALIHSVWYLVISAMGMIIGVTIQILVCKIRKIKYH